MKLRRKAVLALGLCMTAVLGACAQPAQTSTTAAAAVSETTAAAAQETSAAAQDTDKPAAVSAEDWEAMKKEPVFGKEIHYLFNGGACVSAKYLAEVLGYYQEYGINATYMQGGSVVEAVGTGQCMWGTDHIATMLVPVTNGVNITFVCGSHIGCKSIYVPADSSIQTAADLKGKKLAIHDGIGASDQNISYRLLDEYGVDPTSEVEFLNIEDNAATVAALENKEVDASIFSDYFVLANYKDKMRSICSLTTSPEFQDEACCVTSMNNEFIEKNPVHAKYVTMAIKRAGQYARLYSEDAVDLMYSNDKLTGERANQLQIWNTLHFGLSDAFTEKALKEIAEDYIRLGIITKKDLSADAVLEMAYTNVCPDELIPGLTVGDPVEAEGTTVPIVQKTGVSCCD